jgi:hypothetical protein
MSIVMCDCVRCVVCCVLCAVCGVRCAAFKLMQCAAVCGRARYCCVRQSKSVRGSVRGSVRLSSSAAVCGSPAVSIFSNKFKIYDSFKFV